MNNINENLVLKIQNAKLDNSFTDKDRKVMTLMINSIDMNDGIETIVSKIKNTKLESSCRVGNNPSPNMWYGQQRHQKLKELKKDLLSMIKLAVSKNIPDKITVNNEIDGSISWHNDDFKMTKDNIMVKDSW